ncbi:MerR family transcriptional regulator [Eisenibacter elegans]|jgi:MerR family Zn(II)-responsive transcriptional regulator of zntA|uniref:MerR family transcriptional regulator n=1 Tax=Eisenibacter elegans TaxID=997 RepID=UPI000421708D|nr:MerR family transcriptional regulator [Eisenibacter elegans]
MKISELAQKTGFTPDTIRYYEKIGLLPPPLNRQTRNNYRYYDREAVALLLLIKQAKLFGFTLSEIKLRLQEWKDGQIPLPEKIRVFKEKIQLVSEKIAELEQTKQALSEKLKEYQQLLLGQ